MTSVSERVKRVLPVLRYHATECDERAAFPVESLNALRENRLLGLLVPEEYGGAGADLRTFVAVAGELASACLSTAQIWAMHGFQVDAVVQHGSAQLKEDLLPRVAADHVYIASVTSERGRGAGLFTARSPLEADAAGTLLIERSAPVVTGGAHADGFLITMRASSHASENEVSLIYADRKDLHAEPVGHWNTLGMRATESLGMELKGSVPHSNVVGGAGEFAKIARESMIPVSHLGWSACWMGAARGVFGELLQWFAKTGGTHSDLFHERLARIRLDLELVSAYLTRVREEVELARADGQSLANPRHQLQLNALKVTASDLCFRAVDHMVQLAGLYIGYSKSAPIALERQFRDLRSASLNHANDGLRVGIGALSLLDRSVSLI